MIDTPVFNTSLEDNGTEPFQKGLISWRTESFHIRDILRLQLWTSLFISNHMFAMGFMSGD
jgi:hypothetical protein